MRKLAKNLRFYCVAKSKTTTKQTNRKKKNTEKTPKQASGHWHSDASEERTNWSSTQNCLTILTYTNIATLLKRKNEWDPPPA